MRTYKISEYQEVGCMLLKGASSALVFHGLWSATNGKVCIGCFAENKPCHQKLTAQPIGRTGFTVPSETVRDEAKRRSISISEVRRQRNKGVV